jgi:protocatechuate 3,4-dioxygenase alpha subunit
MRFKQTPSQTVGPYFAFGLAAQQYHYDNGQVADGDLAGNQIRIIGRVIDGEGKPVNDALVEIWQADAQGRHGEAGFKGFGRQGTGTDPECRFIFHTVKPGSVDGKQAPHLTLTIFMRGLLTHVFTRLYFDDEAKANEADPVLALVPPERRHTLIARREESATGPLYRFDIVMQGHDETVFFDL